jgi:hypothetical protein
LVAILKAHRDFYAYVIFKANKENLASALQKKYINSYPKSILLDFFLKKKKGFRDIKF